MVTRGGMDNHPHPTPLPGEEGSHAQGAWQMMDFF